MMSLFARLGRLLHRPLAALRRSLNLPARAVAPPPPIVIDDPPGADDGRPPSADSTLRALEEKKRLIDQRMLWFEDERAAERESYAG